VADSPTGANHLYKPTCHQPATKQPPTCMQVYGRYTGAVPSVNVHESGARRSRALFFKGDCRVKKLAHRPSGVWTLSPKWAFWPPFYDARIYCCPPEAQLLQVLQLLRESNAEATVVAPTYQGKWWPLLQELLIGRVELPPVRTAFRPGRSGHVEPWRLMGSQLARQYAAFRVKGLGPGGP
jgi:hypothetical protein